MELYIDMAVVLLYFFVIITAGYLVGKRHKADSARDFLTGGRSLSWFKTGLTMIAMSINPGIMGLVGIGFVWGFAIQWNAVNLWLTAPFAAMFMVPIYWRAAVVTTPELLEKRFGAACRGFFSVIMTAYMVAVIGISIYLGSLVLNEIFGWPLYVCCAVTLATVAFYVLTGGMKTVLSINIYQCGFMSLALIAVGIMTICKAGGFSAVAGIKLLNEAGIVLPSSMMPVDWNIFSRLWYPLPSGLIWATMAGTAWIACNFGMVQRLLAARSEQDAQKAILFCGFGVTVLLVFAYMIGVSVRYLMPDAFPDKAYIKAILTMFPVGVRGLLIAGLVASLLSTIDGLLTASGTLVTEDIYLRFIRPQAPDKKIKNFARITQTVVIISALALIPFAAQHRTVVKFIQNLVADILGVVIALYLVGIFSKRATAGAAFFAMVSGILLAVYLDSGTELSFPNVGISSCIYAAVATLVLSRLEKPPSPEKLENLTVHTSPDAKGPFIGLAAWPGLWKWILAIAVFWLGLTAAWEFYIRIH
jgi:SSS family solute:Na+ symporter